MKKDGVLLPRLEWDFENVPVDERWMCALWEFGRSSERVSLVLPDYRDVLSIQSTASLMASDETPLAVRLLNRVLTAYTNFWKEQKASVIAVSEARSPDLVLRKNRALESLEAFQKMGPMREEAVNLFISLPVKEAEKLTASLQKYAASKSSNNEKKIKDVIDRIRGKTAASAYSCPFPETPWMRLDAQSRTVLARALIDDEFVGDIDEWHQMLTGGGARNCVPVDFAEKYAYLALLPDKRATLRVWGSERRERGVSNW